MTSDIPDLTADIRPTVIKSNDVARIVIGSVVLVLFFIGFFRAAGDNSWIKGWLYIGLMILGHTFSTILVGRKNPELLKRRATFGEGTKTWDYVILTIFGLTFLVTLAIAAFDAGKGWSEMSSWIWWVFGVVLFSFYLVTITWSMVVNPHFEKTVRIQSDRDHKVIDTGPYRFVRHPGYTGIIVGFILSAPFLLGSWWAFVPAIVSVASLVVRTVLEDRVLHAELTGYEEYAQRVRYRLIPGIW